MEEDQLTRKLAVILHADVVGSTSLVQKNESLAHQRIQNVFKNFSETINSYGGITRELRGDALVAEFKRVSDAVPAALAFQVINGEFNSKLDDDIQPQLRIGISLGEVIIADNTITGAGVVLAQRLEQLAEPGGAVVQGSVSETIPARMPFEFDSLGEQVLKGFDQPVRAFAVKLQPGEELPEPEVRTTPQKADSTTLEIPDKPSIAVLPFNNMSGDPEQEYFSDGITEDIITQLSRFTVLFVIARQSSFAFKSEKVDIKKIGQQLGVQFVVEGSVRKAGNRVRITAQLIDADTGNHIWADRYDRKLEDIFAVQDELTETIAATVGGRITANGWQRVRVPRTNFKAYELVLQGQALHFRVLKEANSQAQEVLARALELDPDNVRAHMMLGAVHLLDFTEEWSEAPESSLEQALHHGKRSVQLDELDGQAHAHFGETLVNLGRLDEARVHYERAITLNPVDIVSRALYSLYFLDIGRANEALEQLSMVARLDPFELSWIPWFRGMAFYLLHRYEESVENLLRGSEPITDIHRWLAASYAQIDKKQEAAEHLKHYLQVTKTERPFFPGWTFEAWKPIWTKEFSYQSYSDHFCEGLEKAWACLPDTSLTVLKND
jgi:adenylate cyclase